MGVRHAFVVVDALWLLMHSVRLGDYAAYDGKIGAKRVEK